MYSFFQDQKYVKKRLKNKLISFQNKTAMNFISLFTKHSKKRGFISYQIFLSKGTKKLQIFFSLSSTINSTCMLAVLHVLAGRISDYTTNANNDLSLVLN